MEKLEKTFKQYLDIRVGSGARKQLEAKRESRPSLDAAIKDALGKTFRFHSGDGTSESERNAMYDAANRIICEVQAEENRKVFSHYVYKHREERKVENQEAEQ